MQISEENEQNFDEKSEEIDGKSKNEEIAQKLVNGQVNEVEKENSGSVHPTTKEMMTNAKETTMAVNGEAVESRPKLEDLLAILPDLDGKSLTELIQKASLLLAQKL